MNEVYRFMVNDDIVREYEEGILCRISVSDNGNKKKIEGFRSDDCGKKIKVFFSFWRLRDILDLE